MASAINCSLAPENLYLLADGYWYEHDLLSRCDNAVLVLKVDIVVGEWVKARQ